jgi:hypothetical protein
MKYVERDAQGTITGVYENPQLASGRKGFRTDAAPLADDHADILAFHARGERTSEELAQVKTAYISNLKQRLANAQ